MQSSSWIERIKRARSRSGLIPLRLRRRAVTDSLTTIKTATTFGLSSFHSPPRLSPRINLFRLWKRPPPSPPPQSQIPAPTTSYDQHPRNDTSRPQFYQREDEQYSATSRILGTARHSLRRGISRFLFFEPR